MLTTLWTSGETSNGCLQIQRLESKVSEPCHLKRTSWIKHKVWSSKAKWIELKLKEANQWDWISKFKATYIDTKPQWWARQCYLWFVTF